MRIDIELLQKLLSLRKKIHFRLRDYHEHYPRSNKLLITKGITKAKTLVICNFTAKE